VLSRSAAIDEKTNPKLLAFKGQGCIVPFSAFGSDGVWTLGLSSADIEVKNFIIGRVLELALKFIVYPQSGMNFRRILGLELRDVPQT
jgi:hypothetical protein